MTPQGYGYFGPPGTFTQMALQAWGPAAGGEHTAYDSVDSTLAAVRSGEVEAGMVPIENSVEGGVTATLDNLATGDPLVVIGEVLVPITFVLAARAGTRLEDVTAIGTHSHAWAQVRRWVRDHRPGATYVPTLSTASAAAGLAEGPQAYQAAVCAPVAAERDGLTVLAHDIGDIKSAVTRFVLIARPGALPAPTGADKTTVVLFQRSDHSGGLLELLEQFATRGINMTRLESRPTKDSMGSYCFSIDLEGHVLDERIGEALMGLKRVCADVVFLGSYPRADGQEATIAPRNSDADFAAARDWLNAIRHSV
ncbi:MAG: prephenate dehydratase [Actinobacteria bacterium]|jgi:prephenate dehydratase (EC 4.2.1.51)|nr:prephenate dehydratase [Actinomycetota bacterium]